MAELADAVGILRDLGGWGAFALLVLAAMFGLMRGPKSKLGWVPGWLYTRESERADKAEAGAAASTDAIERLTASVDTIVEAALRERSGRG